VVSNKVRESIDGVNTTIFAYGQTGSGKTYSTFGGESFRSRGIIPRLVSQLFSEIVSARENFRIQIAFTEIYNEVVYDLLDPQKKFQSIEQWAPVQLYEDESGFVLKNVNTFEVTNEEDALSLFFLGSSNRVTSSTPMNDASSRSHAIFTIIIESEVVKDGNTFLCKGKINVVDLAGSERMYKGRNSVGTMKEARAINLSLHYLEQVIIFLKDARDTQIARNVTSKRSSKDGDKRYSDGGALQPQIKVDKSRSPQHSISCSTDLEIVSTSGKEAVSSSAAKCHIPYRNSVLTSILRDSLGGNTRTTFLLTISGDYSQFSESIATCRLV
jgi:kinesin family member 6/9